MSEPRATTEPLTIILRPTRAEDLDAILAIERHPENAPFIGQWTREQHAACIEAADREHWIVSPSVEGPPAGFLIAYDLTADGFGVWIQRIAVTDKSRGIGRAELSLYLDDAMTRFGTDTATLDVMPANARAQRAYRAAGFDRVTLSDEEFARLSALVGGLDDDAVIMQFRDPGTDDG